MAGQKQTIILALPIEIGRADPRLAAMSATGMPSETFEVFGRGPVLRISELIPPG